MSDIEPNKIHIAANNVGINSTKGEAQPSERHIEAPQIREQDKLKKSSFQDASKESEVVGYRTQLPLEVIYLKKLKKGSEAFEAARDAAIKLSINPKTKDKAADVWYKMIFSTEYSYAERSSALNDFGILARDSELYSIAEKKLMRSKHLRQTTMSVS